MGLMARTLSHAAAGAAVLLLAACANTTPGSSAGTAAGAPTTAAAAPAKPALPADEAAAAAADKVVIVFPEGSTSLSAAADQQLDVAARLFRDASPVVMFTSGYADPKGSEFNNLLLSARRAEVVKQALVARGIPSDKLLLQAFGQSAPANNSDPLAAENRRVVITWRLS
jgi:OOP family OmpA-OmpF porin